MINILNNILSNNGYEQVDIEIPLDGRLICLFCSAQETKREEYFVTIQLRTQSDAAAHALLEEEAQELFEVISNSGKVDRPFEKNCTMLLCHDEEGIDRQTILALEEDPYNFKKNVITYTSIELESLQIYLVDKKINNITNIIINSIVNSDNGKGFLEFKDNHKVSKGYYSLILKTALKLPFITYSPREQELTNLSLEIEKSLSKDQYSIYKHLIDAEEEWTDEHILQKIEQIWGKSV